MNLIAISVKNFGPFTTRQQIDFSKLGNLFAIQGSTGAGKSSILEAVFIAFTGTGPKCEGKKSGTLESYVNETSIEDGFKIALIFQKDNEYYRIIRTYKKKKQTIVLSKAIEEASSSEKDDFGYIWGHECNSVDTMETNKDVQARIENIVKLDYNRLSKIFLIPQNMFTELTRPSRPADRRNIILSLAGCDVYKDFGKFISKKLLIVKNKLSIEERLLSIANQTVQNEQKINEMVLSINDKMSFLEKVEEKVTRWQPKYDISQSLFKTIKLESKLDDNGFENISTDDLIRVSCSFQQFRAYFSNELELKKTLEMEEKDLAQMHIFKSSAEKKVFKIKKSINNFETNSKATRALINNFKFLVDKEAAIYSAYEEYKKTSTAIERISATISSFIHPEPYLTIGIAEVNEYTTWLNDYILNKNFLDSSLMEQKKLFNILEETKIKIEKKTIEKTNTRILLEATGKELESKISGNAKNIILGEIKKNSLDSCPVCTSEIEPYLLPTSRNVEDTSLLKNKFDKLMTIERNLALSMSSLEIKISNTNDSIKEVETDITLFKKEILKKAPSEILVTKKIKNMSEYMAKRERACAASNNHASNISKLKSYKEEIEGLSIAKKKLKEDYTDELSNFKKELFTYSNFDTSEYVKFSDLEREILEKSNEWLKTSNEDMNIFNGDVRKIDIEISLQKQKIKDTRSSFSNMITLKKDALELLENINLSEQALSDLQFYCREEASFKEHVSFLIEGQRLLIKIRDAKIDLKNIKESMSQDSYSIENYKEDVLYMSQKNSILREKGKLDNEVEKCIMAKKEASRVRQTIFVFEKEVAALSQLNTDFSGAKIQKFLEKIIFPEILTEANKYFKKISDNKFSFCVDDNLLDKDLTIINNNDSSSPRLIHTLSGGETFQASLSLILGLRNVHWLPDLVNMLIIDEGGFSALDKKSLETAREALESVVNVCPGLKLGIVSHLEDLTSTIEDVVSVSENQIIQV